MTDTAAARAGADPATPGLEPWLREILRCPASGATLVDGVGPDGEPELVSTARENPLAYPVRGGIPVLLVDDARPVRADVAAPRNDPPLA